MKCRNCGFKLIKDKNPIERIVKAMETRVLKGRLEFRCPRCKKWSDGTDDVHKSIILTFQKA